MEVTVKPPDVLKRLKDKAVRRCRQFTEDGEEFVGKVMRLLQEG